MNDYPLSPTNEYIQSLLPVIKDKRFDVCKHCRYYLANLHACRYLKETTARQGRLDHPAGIGNPRARCPHPNRYWWSIPSYHPWYIITNHMPLDRETIHQLTKYGIQHIKPIGVMMMIYSYRASNPQLPPPPSRSVIYEEYSRTMKTPNDYRHLLNQNVNYISGELTPK